MKKAPVLLATLVITVACAGLAVAGEGEAGAHHQDVELGCAKCVYHMEGVKHCAVAAKVGDEVMLVKGGGVDAHALCKGPKRARLHEPTLTAARVELVDGQAASSFKAELGCAMCIYHMDGVEHCTVAAKVGDEVMLVKGGGIDAHGLCGRPKMAEITGKMQEGELHASNIELK